MLYINISFDYELFMGENYVSEKEVLIDPTKKIATMLSSYGVSATFFVDVCCPMQYLRMNENEFPELFNKQLQNLTEMGHDIQLHLHTNWLTATSIGRKIVFDRESYRIHNWANNEDYASVKAIVHNGVEYINRLIKPINPGYHCIAFRAGGFCLQPEKMLAPILYEEGIRIDSSVCRGLKYTGGGMYYDYTQFPKYNNVWFSSEKSLEDNCISPISGGIFEVPVGSYSTFPYRLIASKLNKGIPGHAENGHAMVLPEAEITPVKKSFAEKIKNKISSSNNLSFDFYNAESMLYMIKRIIKEENCRNRDIYITTIAHPKSLSDVRFENMVRVIKSLKNNPYVKFVNMQDIADKLAL